MNLRRYIPIYSQGRLLGKTKYNDLVGGGGGQDS